MKSYRANGYATYYSGWICAIGLASLVCGCDRKAASDPLFCGHIAPLSGPMQERGQQMVRGIQLAVDQLNENSSAWVGNHKVAVIHADSEGKTDVLEAQAVRLLTVNRLTALVAGTNSAQAKRLAGISTEYGAVLITSAGAAGSSPTLTTFCIGISPTEKVRLTMHVVENTLKPTRLILIADTRDSAATDLTNRLSKALSDKKITYDQMRFANADELEERAKSIKEPLLVIFSGTAVDYLKFWKNLGHGAQTSAGLYLGEEEEAQPLLTAADIGEAYWFGTFARENDVQTFVDFRAKFSARFQMEPDFDAATAYTSAQVLFAAAREAKGFNVTKLQPRLQALKEFPGLTGSARMGADHVLQSPCFLLSAKSGKVSIRARFPLEPLETKSKNG